MIGRRQFVRQVGLSGEETTAVVSNSGSWTIQELPNVDNTGLTGHGAATVIRSKLLLAEELALRPFRPG